MKSIDTYARAFLPLNISAVGSVNIDLSHIHLAVLFKHANFLYSSFETDQTSIIKYELINMNETRQKPLN